MPDTLFIVREYFAAKKRMRFSDRASLEKWQRRRLDLALDRVTSQIPFYFEWRDKPLESFPITDKQILMSNFERMNSAAISKELAFEVALKAERTRDFSPSIGELSVGLSTGTSGARGLFLVNRKERLRWAGTILAKALPGPLWKKRRIAFIFRANNRLYDTVRSRRVQFKFFDLLRPFEQTLGELVSFSPQILVAPAQTLGLIARTVAAQKLSLSVEHVISVAEVLDDADRHRIETAFQGPVHQIYQATEGFLGNTCRLGTLHLNEDVLLFERQYLDAERKRFVPIVTDLFRETQAIVRYRLNDILICRQEICPCGSPLQALEKVEGRCDDVLYFPSNLGGALKPAFPDVIRSTLAAASPRVDDFQLVQTSQDHLVLRLQATPDESFQPLFQDSLQRLYDHLDVRPAVLQVEFGIQRDPSQKVRRIQRQFKVPEEIFT